MMDSLKDSHWQVGKQIHHYILGTLDVVILYSQSNDSIFTRYTNNEFACISDDRIALMVMFFS